MDIAYIMRNRKTSDVAKDKAILTVDDLSIEENLDLSLDLISSDGVRIDAEPFKRESSVVRFRYCNGFGIRLVESNINTLKKVQYYCTERAKIQNDNESYNEIHLQRRLECFSNRFLNEHRVDAIDITIAAFELEIKSLVDLMIKDVDSMFSELTNEEKFYNIFFVNLKEYCSGKFKSMKNTLAAFGWHKKYIPWLERPHKIEFKELHCGYQQGFGFIANHLWNPKLLKVRFKEYKSLPFSIRLQWLTSHFILRRRCLAFSFFHYRKFDSDSDCDSDSDYGLEMVTSDGVYFDGTPLLGECLVIQARFMCGFGPKILQIDSNTLQMVMDFCEGHRNIGEDFIYDNYIFYNRLTMFNSKFRQQHHKSALRLIIAAFNLSLRSLIELMMEDVVDLFNKMTTDEVYDIFSVNLKENGDDRKFKFMKDRLYYYKWAFADLVSLEEKQDAGSRGVEPPNNNWNWNPELLKMTFDQYKYLTFDEQRQWLTAHFLLQTPSISSAFNERFKESDVVGDVDFVVDRSNDYISQWRSRKLST
ncbi:uncharacterized protein [Rutidosis leptorrhynchoides]|uniref:uncharacterized protein isoform X2 n=1 Tax=Rutidosis leptorrhynchoides TaxID=125765 RepID=UPI003A9A23C5